MMSVECRPDEAARAATEAAPSADQWVRLKETWINLANVTYIEDAAYWLVIYFRLDYAAHLRQPVGRRERGERLMLFGQEAEEMRGYLARASLCLTPPVPPNSPDEW
ncbi:MAG: hypothetical protein H0W76_08035 [Pyrinomonadaceae bacterium]|nr:hypothetical protein [Pyrinomonadaceae bacterium]